MSTDTERMDALQAWLESADLEAGTITLRVPGLAEGRARVSANLRRTVDGVLQSEGNTTATPSQQTIAPEHLKCGGAPTCGICYPGHWMWDSTRGAMWIPEEGRS